ncbi:MAG: TMEM175 family protein [Thermomonas sp.]
MTSDQPAQTGVQVAVKKADRGSNVTRMEAFVDASFAFAVTLLVISLDAVPSNIPEFVVALKGIPAFAGSFALIAMFWWAHAVWSRRYGLQDGISVLLSLVLVFLVLVYVYPLRMLFSSFFSWASGGWFPSSFQLRGMSDLMWMFVVYAIAWSTLGLVIVALYRHAWTLRDQLQLTVEERIELRGDIASHWMIPLTGALSLAAIGVSALAGRPELGGLSGFVYALMSLSGVVSSRARRRAAQDLG